jgi:septal ring factor EnvC (AmiA/AmiB activator)
MVSRRRRPVDRALAAAIPAFLLGAALGLDAGRPVHGQTATAAPSPSLRSPANYQQEIEREAAELERLRRELEKAREERTSYASRETKILGQLNSLDNDLTLKQRLLSGLERKESRLADELERTRERLQRERARLEERRAILSRRLRNIYKVGEKPGLQVLLGATSAVDLVRRFDWLLLVAAQDRRLYRDVQESVSLVRAAEADLAVKRDEVRSIREESERERAELLEKREERGQLLRSVQGEKLRRERVIGELEEAEKQVQGLLADLEEKAKRAALEGFELDGSTFVAAKGRLPWPVRGKVARWYGIQKDRRFGTSTFNGGIDIEAERESDVLAVHPGRADYVNWLPGYGQCIILSHGDGYYTLYAHTAKVFVSVGEYVTGGDVIASVGDTGSLLGNVLHFEIRKDAEPVDPAPWLAPVRLR